jgi:membrane associated rhomboid family serine protease
MITTIIVVITAIISVMAFNNSTLLHKSIFNPYIIKRNKEWFRFWSAGFIHADFMHLGFNMLALFSFGKYVEQAFGEYIGSAGRLMYILLYFVGMFFSHIFSYIKNQDNPSYNALGASGAVSAVIFSSIVLFPNSEIFFYFIPIKAYIFGPLYLIMSAYLAKQGNDNIGHDAHFYGALFGVGFTFLIIPNALQIFRAQLGF